MQETAGRGTSTAQVGLAQRFVEAVPVTKSDTLFEFRNSQISFRIKVHGLDLDFRPPLGGSNLCPSAGSGAHWIEVKPSPPS
jgi:hypothetical protein